MKRLLILIIFRALLNQATAQITGSFRVGGDLDKFYPVTFVDGGWMNNVATELTIGRSSVHTGSPDWRGSVIGRFTYHTTNWGNESQFIDADIQQHDPWLQDHQTSNPNTFIAGWADPTGGNNSLVVIIWLRGGNTLYYYQSNYAVSPTVYDAGPYQTANGVSYTYKTAPDPYVNSWGLSKSGTAFFEGNGPNFFRGYIGIGSYTPVAHVTFGGMGDHLAIGDQQWPNKIILSTGWTSQNSDYTDLRVPGATANNAIMRLQANGGVAIGTTAMPAADAKLAVKGNIYAQKVKVTQEGWSDYVFHATYRLRPLSEVEEYIKQHRHLPEVPSAAEVKKDGLDLGDNQATLLKKIEELTLYVIEQNKRNEDQDKRIQQLERQLTHKKIRVSN